MRTSTLLARNLQWYWRTNLAVLLGVAVATGILGGAILVGHSVRASLRALLLERLGNTEAVVTRNGFFREELAAAFQPSAPVIAMEAVVGHERSGRRAAGVQVYGIDERFWKLQSLAGEAPRGRDILITGALARELDARGEDTLLLRVPKPPAIPFESLHGAKEDTGKTLRLALRGVAPREFSLRPQQGELRAVYVPLARLQRELNQAGKVNTILAGVASRAAPLERILARHYSLADLGLKVRVLDGRQCLSLESDSGLIGDALADVAARTARGMGLRAQPVLAYLANSIRGRGRAIPYSVVAAVDSSLAPAGEDGIVLNDWAARDLAVKPGDPLDLDYYVWKSDGRLHTETARFRMERAVPLAGDAADPQLTPEYPGITESESPRDWDPPFPVDLSRVRPQDERYWERYRTTPKAFIRLQAGRRLWGTRFGSITSMRAAPPSPAYAEALRAALDPGEMGLQILPVRARGLEAAQGATDFGEYFVYFSFFLIAAALLLTGLFFKLGIEQRSREIGVLRALGFPLAKIRSVFLLEGAALAAAGAAAGVAAAIAYGALILFGLGTWWFDAVRTRSLTLHASLPSLAAGAAAGAAVGLAAVAWALRRLSPATPRGLVAGERQTGPGRWRLAGAGCAGLGAAGLAFSHAGQTTAFFGAGTLLLICTLLLESAWLHGRKVAAIGGQITLGLRSVAYHPGRSTVCIALIAAAVFVIVSMEAFHKDGNGAGTGGFPFVAESVLPVVHNPGTAAGRTALGLPPPADGLTIIPFRLQPGDDASCLNLYRPRSPRVLGAPAGFIEEARFEFQEASGSPPNPWKLLEGAPEHGVIPAIADANSMTYVLHLKLGQEFTRDGVHFRIVAALRDSLFQGELLISEANFLRLFPDSGGYRFFLVNAAPEDAAALAEPLAPYGFRVQPAAQRLAAFHAVENAYLATFRALGGLGLVLGTVGMAAILMRNVLERRKELALLRAVGYRARHLCVIVIAENLLLLAAGVATGAACAAIAVAPAVAARGGKVPAVSLAVLMGGVLAAGVAASLIATAAALRPPVLEALRSE